MRQVVIYPGEDGFWIAECPVYRAASARARHEKKLLSIPTRRLTYILRCWLKMAYLKFIKQAWV